MKKLIGSKSRLLIVIGFLVTIMNVSDSCMKDTMTDMNVKGDGAGTKGDGPGTNEVWIQSMAYDPSVITVATNTTITWTNKDAISHTVTSDTGLFDSGNIGNNGTFSHTFSTAGTFQYHCSVHPSMTAIVIVN